MSLLPQPTRVYVVAPDASVQDAISRLLTLDSTLDLAATRRSADVVIDESLLHEFKNLSIASFIDMVKALPRTPSTPKRHLAPVPTTHDMRALLSDRELQVVRLVAEGLSNKEISLRMKLSDKTIKNHISHILAKLHLTARTQVAVHALRAGLA